MLDDVIKIFYSYSRKDLDMQNILENHLSALREAGKVSTWHDLELKAGVEWEPIILDKLNTADIILLLVSRNFIASKYCYGTELKRAMARHNKGTARVIPIILSSCDWNHPDVPFSKLNVLPTHATSIKSYADPDEAFTIVARQIRETVDELIDKKRTEQQRQVKEQGSLDQDQLKQQTPKEERLEQEGEERRRQEQLKVKIERTYKDNRLDDYDQLVFTHTGSLNQGTPVTLLAVTSDKKILVAGNREYGIIRLWDLNSYELLFEFSIEDGIRSLAISTDNKILATSSGRKIRKWHLSKLVNRNASQSEVLYEFPAGRANVGVIGFLRNNFKDELMAVGYGDEVQLWRVNASYEATFLCDLLPLEREYYLHLEESYYYADAEEQFSRPISEVCCLSFSPDGIYIAAGYKRWRPDTVTDLDDTIKVWDLNEKEIIRTLSGHLGETKSLAFSPDGKVIASCGLEDEIRLWNVETGEEIMKGSTIKGSSRTSSINFNLDGRILFSGEESGVIRLWDFQNGKHIGNLEQGKGSVNSIIFTQDKRTLISGHGDGTIHIWTPNNK